MNLLLDTHALLWIAEGRPISESSRQAIAATLVEDRLLVSAVSVWELGILVRKQRLSPQRNLRQWLTLMFERLPMLTGIPLELSVAAAEGALPAPFHDDPADRLLVATARHLDVPLVTRDERILKYAEAGHVRAIAC